MGHSPKAVMRALNVMLLVLFLIGVSTGVILFALIATFFQLFAWMA